METDERGILTEKERANIVDRLAPDVAWDKYARILCEAQHKADVEKVEGILIHKSLDGLVVLGAEKMRQSCLRALKGEK